VGSWVVALALVVPGAIVMLRNLERDGRRKARLLAHPPVPAPQASAPPAPPTEGGTAPPPAESPEP